jgi:hypothetical protein
MQLDHRTKLFSMQNHKLPYSLHNNEGIISKSLFSDHFKKCFKRLQNGKED